MSDFVVVTMKQESTWDTIISGLLPSNPLSKLQPGRNMRMSDLGLRELYRKDGQAIYMEHWDGASPVVDIEDIINLVPAALAANKGKVKFWLTDEVQASISSGKLKKLVDAGLFDVGPYSSYP